jgi:hypothetical protein
LDRLRREGREPQILRGTDEKVEEHKQFSCTIRSSSLKGEYFVASSSDTASKIGSTKSLEGKAIAGQSTTFQCEV